MSNNFKIVISATDKATSVVRKINDEFSRTVRPFSNLHRAAANLGREIGKNPIAKGFSAIGKAAVGVAEGIAKIAAPMAAVAGIGSIAGVAALATEWGHLGFEIAKTSATLGMATSDLQALRGAAQLAGVSSESMTSSLKSLGDTMQDALGGRNQSALLMLDKIGVSIHKTADGSIDAARGFKEIGTYIASIKNAQVQGLVARMFGLESALPLLRKGAKGIEEYQKKIAEFGGIQSQKAINSAEEFGMKLNELSAAGAGLRNEIGNALMPALKPLVEQFTAFIALNREAIGLKIGEWAKKLGEWLSRIDFDATVAGIKKIGIAIGVLLAANMLASLASFATSMVALGALVGIAGPIAAVAVAVSALAAACLVMSSAAGGKKSHVGKKYVSMGTFHGGSSGQWIDDPDAPKKNNRILPMATMAPAMPVTPNLSLKFNDPVLNQFAAGVEKKLGLPPNILNSIKNFGERSNSNDVSSKGARGVMQFMPETWRQFGKGDPRNPTASIEASGSYMQDLLRRYHGNIDAAITEYNGGSAQAKAVEQGGHPWAPETKNYLARVKNGMDQMNGNSSAAAPQNMTITIEGLPVGVTAKARPTGGGGSVTPVRINHSMPTLAAG